MILPLQGLRNRAQDVVVSVLGAADDYDHRGFGPALAAHVVGCGGQLVRDRAVPALEVPVLGGTAEVSVLQVHADLGGKLAGGIVEAEPDLGRGVAADIGGGRDGGDVRHVDDLHAAAPVVQEPGGRIEGSPG